MIFLNPPSIQKRMALALIVVVSVILLLASIIFIVLEKGSIEHDLKAQLQEATTLATESLPSALWQYNYDYVSDFVESLFLYKDVVFAQVLVGNESIKTKVSDGFKGRSYDTFAASSQFISQSAKIRYQSFEIGTIRISMSKERIRKAILSDTMGTLILIMASITAIFFTVFFLTGKHIFKPLARLEASAKMIAKGDLDAPIDTRSQDEIGQLAKTFKLMIVNLKKITASRDELDHQVRERLKAETELRDERDRAQTYLDIAGVMLLAIDKSQMVTMINKRGCDILGRKEEEILGRNWFDHFIEPEQQERVKNVFNQLMAGERSNVEYFENRVIARKGPPRLMAWYNTLLTDKEGKILGTLSSGEDITQRRQAEDRVQASLEEKEILLREIHHRVKNNLQMIQSLLNLHADKVNDPTFQKALMESNNRIKSMALIHETLYQSKDIAQLNIERYFYSFIRHLIRVYHRPEVTLDLDLSIDQLKLDLDTSIACGIIINELVTNALKYAFPNGHKARLKIQLIQFEPKMAELLVQDNGVGLPADFSIKNCNSLGLRLVTMMAEDQLDGNLQVLPQNGTTFRIRFPLDIAINES